MNQCGASDVEDLGTVAVHWSPEACIADTQASEGGLSKIMSAVTNVRITACRIAECSFCVYAHALSSLSYTRVVDILTINEYETRCYLSTDSGSVCRQHQ